MATKKPRVPKICIVSTVGSTDVHYVRALTRAGAIAHVVAKIHEAKWASADDMLGVKAEEIETAGQEEE
jgi:hypothetical protein